MALTKSEFDRLMAERVSLLAQVEEREKALKRSPECAVGRITGNGYLDMYGAPHAFASDQTRALYEMLRAWYEEATMSEAAKAVVDAAEAWEASPASTAIDAAAKLLRAIQAYRAEQKQ